MHWLGPAGSSRGLVCLKKSDILSQCIVVWNPATKQFRFLPETDDYYLLGFEFFHDIRDYKVVSILQPDLNNTIRAKVFTGNTNSWREVKSHYCCLSRPFFLGTSRSITLNGVLYAPLWIQEQRSHVLSFNLLDEVFHVIPLPESSSTDRMRLLSWKNSLAFIGGPEYEPLGELWVMTEEPSAGTAQITWVKQFILEPSALPGYILGSWKDEYLILGDDYFSNELYCYDPAIQKSARLPQLVETDRYSYYRTIDYVESLVSVD
ncbi:PREDICTED: uncharacterized protein LOC101312291 [Fragaria vesca subsp. vesca]|uniref:uncharacterized protein LOC101312291 n=1 Tax=Fragaria vesca subsp. vesca TaxID=101020 RepID=UPI0002C30A10|nr:PREDICTED: uncharacterized protein LOC101312291 [Fragaria vesca subsp. vesca]